MTGKVRYNEWRVLLCKKQEKYRALTMKTRMKEFRARYDLTQEELAKKVGVRRETIVFLEKGKYNPSLKLAYDIAKVLNSNIAEVFIFDDE